MSDESTLRQNIDLWAQQYNDHDAAALAAWYTKDCVYITPTGLGLMGPDQIGQYFHESFRRSPEVKITVQVQLLRMERPDLAIARGTFEVTNAVDPKGKPLSMKGPWVTTFLMQDGRWIPLVHGSAMALEAYAPLHV